MSNNKCANCVHECVQVYRCACVCVYRCACVCVCVFGKLKESESHFLAMFVPRLVAGASHPARRLQRGAAHGDNEGWLCADPAPDTAGAAGSEWNAIYGAATTCGLSALRPLRLVGCVRRLMIFRLIHY